MNKENTTAQNMQAVNTEGIKFQRYPAYKDSGVEWLGEIPAHWNIRRLKYFFSNPDSLFVDGDWIESKDIDGTDVKYITTGNIGEGVYKEQGSGFITFYTFKKLKCTEVKEGDILISRLNLPLGRCCIAPKFEKPTIVSVDVVICRMDACHNREYFMYLMNSPLYQEFTELTSRGAIMKRISRTILGNFSLCIPPLPEQTRIATFLDHKTALIDKAIAQKERLIGLLQERRQVLIHRAVTRGLNPDVPMKDSGVEWIGEVPGHWGVKKLKHIVKFIGGGTPSKENAAYWNGEIPWISPKDMKKDEIEDSQDHISELAISNSSVTLVPPDAVLIVVRGMILAHSFPTAILKKPGTINQDMKALVCNQLILPRYLQLFFKGMRDFIVSLTSESSHGTKKLESSIFQNLEVFFPPIEEQRESLILVDEETNKIDLAVKNMNHQIEKLQELKTTLIDAAVTGKIKVWAGEGETG